MDEKVRRIARWSAEHPLLAISLIVVFLAVLILAIWTVWPSQAPSWSGIQQDADIATSKTLWDWLELLLIPLALLAAAWWVSRSKQAPVVAASATRAHPDEHGGFLDDRYQENRLQAYFSRIGRLLIEHGLREAKQSDEVRRIARAQTLTVLWGLNGERKGALTRFLHEAELIVNPDPIISLAGANLAAADLRGADLKDSNLRQAHLIKANLARAQLSKSDLAGADLQGADLRGALSAEGGPRTEPWTPPNLSNTNLNGVILRQAYLSGIDLNNASMDEANLEGADLSEAILRQCGLAKANLSMAKLRDTNLRQAILNQSLLSKADLSGAIVVDAKLAGAVLRGAICAKANFKGSDLSEANLAGATLTNAFFQECDLRGADLTAANLRGANLSGANLTGATLKDADLRGAYLSTAKITTDQLSVALSIEGATLPGSVPGG
jgi:uncharacterized protein YjbI with pentapeptide repeats